jgi:hypothetical protein
MSSRLSSLKPIVITAAIAAGFAAGKYTPKSESIADCSVSSEDDPSAKFIELMARRAIRKNALEIRHELKAGIDGDLDIGYRFIVGEEGTLRIKDAYIVCGREGCYGESELPELIGMLIAQEFSLHYHGNRCTLEFRVSVPKLGVPEEPVIRLPIRPGEGIEL